MKSNNKKILIADLTEKEMIDIIKRGTISKQPRKVRDKICAFAFGEEYISSNDKGTLKDYEEV